MKRNISGSENDLANPVPPPTVKGIGREIGKELARSPPAGAGGMQDEPRPLRAIQWFQ